MQTKLRQQKTTVAWKGKQVGVSVYERLWTDGSMGMHVIGVIKDAEQVAKIAYEQLVKEQKIISSYVLIPELTRKAAPVSGAFVEFLDYRSEQYRDKIAVELAMEEYTNKLSTIFDDKKVQA